MTQAEWVPALRARVRSLMQQEEVPGIALAVAQGGTPTFMQGFGYRNLAQQLPVTPETVFGIASVTKSFTALVIMQLVDDGRLAVTDPVVKWLPEFQVPHAEWGGQITVHHLLTHTSGLPGMQALFAARAGSIRQDPDRHRLGLAYDPWAVELIRTWEELLVRMRETEYTLLGPPGSLFNYSDEGYALLQGIAERAGGRPFAAHLQERVLDPLGMRSTVLRTEELQGLPEVTELYASDRQDGKKVVFHSPVWWDVGEIYTNGSLKSNVQDLLRYLEVYRCRGEVRGQRILSEAGVAQMMTAHVHTPFGEGYGYGLHVNVRDGITFVGHSGGIKGVSSDVLLAVEPGVTVVALANLAGVSVGRLTEAASQVILGLPAASAPTAAPEAGDAQEALGLYRSAEGGAVRLLLRDGVLCVETQGLTLPARFTARDALQTAEGGVRIRLLRDAAGEVWGLFMGVRVLHRVRA